MPRKRKNLQSNYKFIDSSLLNDSTFSDYLDRFQKLALSIFEWVNLPSSMNARYLEETLYFDGQASLLKHKDYGFLNLRCSSAGNLNIYGLPSKLHCYSYDLHEYRNLYTGFKNEASEDNEAILVGNNWNYEPTCGSMELFAMRLAEAERTCDVNLKSQKFPVIVAVDEKQRLMMENLYNQYNGNQPFIFGDKKQLDKDSLKAINTGAPYVIDKITEYKKEIWNEALTFLGINNIMVDKKERLITDEANSNNELINLNLQSYLVPRKEACKQFNELFGLTGTDKEISVRVRSDLHNLVKNLESSVSELSQNLVDNTIKKELKEGVENG